MKRLVIDTETSGLSADTHEMLTIGMLLIDVDKDKLDILEERHLLLKHDKYNLSRSAMHINNINIVEHDKHAIPIKKVIQEINNFIEEYDLKETITIGHNFHFDQRFIRTTFEKFGCSYPFSLEKEDTRYIWEGLKKKGIIDPCKNAKLGTLAEHFDIDYSKAHDALADCKVTAQVYHKMLKLSPTL